MTTHRITGGKTLIEGTGESLIGEVISYLEQNNNDISALEIVTDEETMTLLYDAAMNGLTPNQ